MDRQDRYQHQRSATEEIREKPDPTAYGQLVDKMVATVATWPAEYQRSVDVHKEFTRSA